MAIEIEGYEVIRELGKGSVATVYLAKHKQLEREVALKVLSPALAADANYAERFLKERHTLGKLSHPNVVMVYDSGVSNNHHYMAMEYLAGGGLEERAESGMTAQQIIGVVSAIATALSHAHKMGFVHRDLKPQNIMFRSDDTPVLTDFGIAKSLQESSGLTLPGVTLGNPNYMSPEQIKGETVDARSDLYNLGVLLYKVVTGDYPYSADNMIAIAYMASSATVPKVAPELADLQPVLDKMLANDPNNRFPDADALIAALEEVKAKLDARGPIPVPIKSPSAPAAAKPKPKAQPKPQAKPAAANPAPRPAPVANEGGGFFSRLKEAFRVLFGGKG